MSHLTTILAITAIALAQIVAFWFVDRILRDRLDAIVSGVVRGVEVPTEHRRLSLWLSYLWHVGGAVAGQLGLGICWLVAARAAVEDDVRFLCHAIAWVTLMGVIAWIAIGVLWHRHLASLLRQAEAD